MVGGRVQGVYYRASTVETAERLGLRGWAKNLPDGRVEVVVAGASEALAELTAWLWQGPQLARVDSVDLEPWGEAVPDGFDIR